MYKAELKELTVTSSQGNIRPVTLVYHIDGNDIREPYFQTIDELGFTEDTTRLNRAHPFESEITIKLYKSRFADDEIDRQKIVDTSETTGFLTFRDGSEEFELEYEVTDEGSTSKAEIALQDFRDSSRNGAWQKINKNNIISSLDHYATNPADQDSDQTLDVFELDQGSLGYCSNIAIAFSLAWRKPRRFIEASRAMYEQGWFLSRTHSHPISNELKRSTVPSGIDPFEWLFCAAIEDSENWLTNVTSNNTQEGARNEFEKYWLDEIVGYENASVTYDDSGTQDVLDDSNTALSNDGAAILGLDSEMIRSPPNGFLNNPSGKPANQMDLNHAVTLTRGFVERGDNPAKTAYTIHTWGDRLGVNHPTNIVHNYIYDTVAGWD